MGAAAFSVLEPHEVAATIECKINYTRAVTGGELVHRQGHARGHPHHSGRR
ncbi:hypothetical protein UMZ34_10795 [Halopseudomonas pachastrellae]|nr:hypothetical protein UMZ34_10795 [Halopseudomonas pachastrellae]